MISPEKKDEPNKQKPAHQRFQEDQAAKKIQRIVRKQLGNTAQRIVWQFNALKNRYKNTPENTSATVMYPSDVLSRFEYRGHLGKGSSGSVFAVFDKKDGKEKAYKYADALKYDIEIVINEALDKGYTPHLTKIYSIIKLKDAAGLYSLGELGQGVIDKNLPYEIFLANFIVSAQAYEKFIKSILNASLPEDYWVYTHSDFYARAITLMEKIDGDLRKRHTQKTLADKIQLASACFIMDQVFNTLIEDHEDYNIFYKILTDSDTFQGKKLIDFDYWLYKIGNDAFYIPKPDYILKLGDYDDWSVCSAQRERINPVEFLRVYLGGEDNLEEARETFKKPSGVDDNRILDMSPPAMEAKKAPNKSETQISRTAHDKPNTTGINTKALNLVSAFDKSTIPTTALLQDLIRHNVPLDHENPITKKTVLNYILSDSNLLAKDISTIFIYHPDLKIDEVDAALAAGHLNANSFRMVFNQAQLNKDIKIDFLSLLEHAMLNSDSTNIMRIILEAASKNIHVQLENGEALSSGYILIDQLCSDDKATRTSRNAQRELLAEFNIDPKRVAEKLGRVEEVSRLETAIEKDRPTLNAAEKEKIIKFVEDNKPKLSFFKPDPFIATLKQYTQQNDRLAILGLVEQTLASDSSGPNAATLSKNKKRCQALHEILTTETHAIDASSKKSPPTR